MKDDFVPTEVLITVMTYPHPSRGTRVGMPGRNHERWEWVRLYPIDYRHRPRISSSESTNG